MKSIAHAKLYGSIIVLVKTRLICSWWCWRCTVDTLLYFLYIHLKQVELSLSNTFTGQCWQRFFYDLSTEWPKERSGGKEEAWLSQDEFDILVLGEWWGNKAPPSPGNDLRGTGRLWAYATGNLITVTHTQAGESCHCPFKVRVSSPWIYNCAYFIFHKQGTLWCHPWLLCSEAFI